MTCGILAACREISPICDLLDLNNRTVYVISKFSSGFTYLINGRQNLLLGPAERMRYDLYSFLCQKL